MQSFWKNFCFYYHNKWVNQHNLYFHSINHIRQVASVVHLTSSVLWVWRQPGPVGTSLCRICMFPMFTNISSGCARNILQFSHANVKCILQMAHRMLFIYVWLCRMFQPLVILTKDIENKWIITTAQHSYAIFNILLFYSKTENMVVFKCARVAVCDGK